MTLFLAHRNKAEHNRVHVLKHLEFICFWNEYTQEPVYVQVCQMNIFWEYFTQFQTDHDITIHVRILWILTSNKWTDHLCSNKTTPAWTMSLTAFPD